MRSTITSPKGLFSLLLLSLITTTLNPGNFVIAGNITVSLDSRTDNPTFDPDGQKLWTYAQSAAHRIASQFDDSLNISLDIRWGSPSGAAAGYADGLITLNRNVDWYFDDAFSDNDYDLETVYGFQLSDNERFGFVGNVPDYLPIGTTGLAKRGTNARGKRSAKWGIEHEIFHAIGLSRNQTRASAPDGTLFLTSRATGIDGGEVIDDFDLKGQE